MNRRDFIGGAVAVSAVVALPAVAEKPKPVIKGVVSAINSQGWPRFFVGDMVYAKDWRWTLITSRDQVTGIVVSADADTFDVALLS